MFIECQTHYDKSVSYNVNNIVFVGELKDKVSILFDVGTFCSFPDEYVSFVKKIIELLKIEISPFLYVQFTTKKDERIAFPIKRIFSIIEEESTTAILFNDGTRVEVLADYNTVINRINDKLGQAAKQANGCEETKN